MKAGLTRHETTWTMFRYDGTLPGIMAKLEDGVGRAIHFWVGQPGWGYQGKTVTVCAQGRNGQTSVAVDMAPDEARSLAASLLAMADAAEREAARVSA